MEPSSKLEWPTGDTDPEAIWKSNIKYVCKKFSWETLLRCDDDF